MATTGKRNHRTPRNTAASDSETSAAVAEPGEDIDDLLETEAEEPESASEPEPAPAVSDKSDPRRIPPAPQLPPDQFFAFVAQIPDPLNFDLYVYRLEPAIRTMRDPRLPVGKRQPTYVEKVKGLITTETGRAVDFEWLKVMRGSGKYHITLNDRSLKRTKEHQVLECLVSIADWTTHPPVLNDWSELVDCDANKWFIDRMIREKVIARSPEGRFVPYNQNEPPPPQNGSSQDLGVLLDKTVGHAVKLAQTMAPREQAKGDDSFMQIWLSQLATEREERRAEREREREERKEERKQSDAAREESRKQAEAAREDSRKERDAGRDRDMKFMEKMLDRAEKAAVTPTAPAAVDPIAAIKAQAESYVVLKDAFGGGEAAAAQSRMSGWQEFLKEPIIELFGLLKPFAQVGAAVMATKMQPAPPQQPRQPAPPANATQPPTPIQQPAASTAAPQQEQHQPQEQQRMDPTFMLLNAAISHVDFTLRDHFANDLDGGEFAEWFANTAIPLPPPYNMMQDSVLGIDALKRIQSMTGQDPEGNAVPAPAFGKAIILAAYKNNPNVWQKIATSPDREAKFETFLDEFLAYNPDEEKP